MGCTLLLRNLRACSIILFLILPLKNIKFSILRRDCYLTLFKKLITQKRWGQNNFNVGTVGIALTRRF